MKAPKPIQIKKGRKGLLHAKLGVPQGQPIPAAKIAKAKNSSSPALRKEATFAQNAKKFAHPGDNDPLPVEHTSKHH